MSIIGNAGVLTNRSWCQRERKKSLHCLHISETFDPLWRFGNFVTFLAKTFPSFLGCIQSQLSLLRIVRGIYRISCFPSWMSYISFLSGHKLHPSQS